MEDIRKFSATMLEMVDKNPDLLTGIKENPTKGLEALVETAADQYDYSKDMTFFIIALCILGVIAISAAIAMTIYPSVPASLVSIGSASIGAIVGLFSPSPVSDTK